MGSLHFPSGILALGDRQGPSTSGRRGNSGLERGQSLCPRSCTHFLLALGQDPRVPTPSAPRRPGWARARTRRAAKTQVPPRFPSPRQRGPKASPRGCRRGEAAPRTVPCAAGWHRLCPGPQVGGQAGGAATSKPNPLTVTKSTTAAERGSGLSGCPGGLGARLSLLAHRKLVVTSRPRPQRRPAVPAAPGPGSGRPRLGLPCSPNQTPPQRRPPDPQPRPFATRPPAAGTPVVLSRRPLFASFYKRHQRDDLCVSVAERGRGVLRFGRTSGRRGERPCPTPTTLRCGGRVGPGVPGRRSDKKAGAASQNQCETDRGGHLGWRWGKMNLHLPDPLNATLGFQVRLETFVSRTHLPPPASSSLTRALGEGILSFRPFST